MVDAFRSMLDELMGKERDVPLDRRQNKPLEFDDPDVCKYELVGLCPNRLFRNTKSDLGSCGFTIHDDHLEWPAVKETWDKLPQRDKDRYPYQRDLMRYLEQLIRDMDVKIKRNKERAEAESRPKVLKPDDQRRLDDISARQADMVARAAHLGEMGDIDGAMECTKQADILGQQHATLHKQLTEPERTMTVCDICGVFINSTDNEQRRLDHLTGKQYLGWKKIRETYADMVKAREERFRGPPREERDRDRPRSHSRGGEPDARERERDPRDRHEREQDPRERERGSSREHRDRDRDFAGPPRGRDLDGPPRGDRYRDRDYDRREFERREMERRERERHGSSRERERSPARRDRRYNEVPPPGKYERDHRRY
eukprot:GHUV01018856.1.p1 GENE.GHUV01018856.1~~GHUV01018856.1.p1  ORF type:complete len:371 (+),score=85.32 GHUV01018856.1:301-1413(+)